MFIKEKVKRQRERLNLSQAELGEKVGLKQRGISYWENGLSTPSIEQVEKLSEIFEVPIVYWFQDSEIINNDKDNVTALLDRLIRNKTITDPDDIPEPVAKMILDAVRMDLRMRQLEK
jgi:transcriptional regulator with XRE-family HTH domain